MISTHIRDVASNVIFPVRQGPDIYEMEYLPVDDLGATIFFQVSACYERGSIILTRKNQATRSAITIKP